MAERKRSTTMETYDEEYQHLISTLPTGKGFMLDTQYLYQGFWYDSPSLRGTLIAQKQHYYHNLDDAAQHSSCFSTSSSSTVLLASHPKTGTTWLKSLLFALITRTQHQTEEHNPLLTSNPHDVVPFIEFHAHNHPLNPVPHNTSLLATHIPFNSLPDSIKSSSGCRIVYVYRDPKDVLISLWHFANRYRNSLKESSSTLLSLEAAVDLFCEGKSMYGPYWDHVLGYWQLKKNSSLSTDQTQRILFISYEEMMMKSKSSVDWLKKLADFIGQPFTADEEKNGVPDSILNLCSFKSLSGMEINKPGSISASMPDFMKMTNDLFFRKAEVGDHRNYLTHEMVERIDNITQLKWGKVGFLGN